MHGLGVVARPEAVVLVKLVGRFERGHVDLDAEAGAVGYRRSCPPTICSGSLRQLLAVLPDPVGVDRGDLARRGRRHMREHRQRDVEMVVGMRAPGQAVVAAGLRHAHRALHGPEMRIGQRDVDRAQAQAMRELPPVGRDHVGRGRQAGGAAELRHDLAAGKAGFGAARVLGIGEDAVHVPAQADGFLQRPGAVGVERHARLGKASGQGGDGFDFFLAAQHAALELEVVEAVAVMRRLGETHDRVRRQGFFVAQAEPVVVGVRRVGIGQIGLACGRRRKTDSRASRPHRAAGLRPARRQREGRDAGPSRSSRAEFNRGDGMNRDAQVEGLLAAPAGSRGRQIAARTASRMLLQAPMVLPDDQVARVFERLADLLAARHLADADMAGTVGQDARCCG